MSARVQADMWAEYCRQWATPAGRGSEAIASFHHFLGPVDDDMRSGSFQLAATRALDAMKIKREFA